MDADFGIMVMPKQLPEEMTQLEEPYGRTPLWDMSDRDHFCGQPGNR